MHRTDGESEQLGAICRCSSFSSFLRRRTSLILPVDFLLAGKRFSLQGQGRLSGVDVQHLYLWKTFRGQAEQRSGASQKVFGFILECCSASARNGVRLEPGIVFGLARNTHPTSKSRTPMKSSTFRSTGVTRSAAEPSSSGIFITNGPGTTLGSRSAMATADDWTEPALATDFDILGSLHESEPYVR